MFILGAGLSGLIAAHYFRDYNPGIFEKNPGPIDNHGALLRFRSDAVMQITNAPLRPVRVTKSIMDYNYKIKNECTLKDANAYSYKVTGKVQARSIIDLSPVDRWVAENNFMEKLRENIDIQYDHNFNMSQLEEDDFTGEPIISTIPITFFYNQLADVDNLLDFESKEIITFQATFENVDINQTVYLPYGEYEPYRVSFTGNKLIGEIVNTKPGIQLERPEMIKQLLDRILPAWLSFKPGMTSGLKISKQKYGKISPIDNRARQRLIAEITNKWNVYSLGRFATWRQILADDVVNDLRVIRKLIESDKYSRKIHWHKET